MPSTITAFYQFTPGTKARSSEVDANFSNMRGTLLPIEEDTAAASHLEHDVGSAEHRWLTGYFGTVDLRAMTTTAALKFQAQTAVTLGAAELLAGSNTLGNFAFGEFGFGGLTSTQYTKFQYQAGVTAGALDLLMGSTTLGTWTTDGYKRKHVAPLEWTTTANPVGTSLFTAHGILGAVNANTTLATICSARFTARGGGIVQAQLANAYFLISAAQTITGQDFYIRLYRGFTTTAMTLTGSWPFSFATTAGQTTQAYFSFGATTSSVPILGFIDASVSAGAVIYEWRYAHGSGMLLTTLTAYGSIFIKEL